MEPMPEEAPAPQAVLRQRNYLAVYPGFTSSRVRPHAIEDRAGQLVNIHVSLLHFLALAQSTQRDSWLLSNCAVFCTLLLWGNARRLRHVMTWSCCQTGIGVKQTPKLEGPCKPIDTCAICRTHLRLEIWSSRGKSCTALPKSSAVFGAPKRRKQSAF